MGLEKIEVENFKSYAGHHIIGPFDKFTCVIGPNGSGKSNIMDAIAFAFGVVSSVLRTPMAVNLIHNGQSQASVKVFVNGHTFRRHITSSGRSTYFYDGKIVPYENYSCELENLNINLKLRNFMVFQGDIHEMANKNPKELCEYFEVLSGSIQFKKEYDETQSVLTKNLSECAVLYEQKKNVLAVMKEEKEEEKQLNILKKCLKEKEKLEKQILNLEIKEIKMKLKDTVSELESINKKQSEYIGINIKQTEGINHSQLESINHSQLEGLNHSQFEGPILINKENQLKQKKEEVEKLRKEFASLEDNLQNLKLKKMTQIREMTSLYKMKDKANIRKKEVNEMIIENEKSIKETKEALEKENNTLINLEESYKLNQEGIKIDKSLEEIYLKNTISLKQQIEEIKREIEEIEKEEKKVKITKKKEIEKKAKLEKIQTLKNNYSSLKNNISTLYEKMGEDLKNYENLEKEEEFKNKKFYETVGELLKIRASKKINLKKETIRSAVNTLKNIFPGVHGILIDLITPIQKKYQNPLVTILQSFEYAVVVNSASTAMACINFIKEKKMCRMVFLPLKDLKTRGYGGKHEEDFDVEGRPGSVHEGEIIDKVDTKDKTVDLNIHNPYDPSYRPAINCVSFDDKFTKAVQFVLKDTLITGTREKALELAYKRGFTCDICSLDNFFIQSQGRIISTYKVQEEGEASFSRLVEERKNLLNEIKIIQDKKSRMSKIEIVRERIKVYEEKMEKDKEEIRILEGELSGCGDGVDKELGSIGSDKDRADLGSDKLDKGLGKLDLNNNISTSLESRKSSLKMNLNNMVALLKTKEIEVFGDLFSPSSYEEYKRLSSPEKILEFQNLKGKLKSKIRILENELEDLEIQREDLIREKSNIDLNIKELNPEIESEIMKYDFLLEKKKGELESSLKDFNKTNEEYKEILRNKKKIDSDYLNLEIIKNRLEEELEEKIRFGELEEIEIIDGDLNEGLDEGLGRDIGLDEGSGRDLSNDLNRPRDQHYHLKDNLRLLKSSLALVNTQINDLVPSLKHTKKSSNYEKTLSDYEEAKKKAMDTRKKLNEIKRERTSTFMKCFEIVSGEIGKIYQDISISESSKGNAYLVLDNPTEPYLDGIRYHVMPPTKRFREIGYLSGGEKSMAILALMFSINLYMPVPFFILDEFDSALDNTNVNRMVDFFVRCDVQFLVISLKPILFQYADSLVGVYQDPVEKSSKILTYRI